MGSAAAAAATPLSNLKLLTSKQQVELTMAAVTYRQPFASIRLSGSECEVKLVEV